MSINFQIIKTIAKPIGLSVVSCLDRAQIETTMKLEKPRLRIWQNAGYAGDMKYMGRSPDLICHPEELLPGYKSIVTFFFNYRNSFNLANYARPRGYGQVSAYATVKEYHDVVKKKISQLVLNVEEVLKLKGVINYRIFADAVPVLERAMAAAAGFGFIGKNSMFIKPGIGSFGFLGEVIWDLEFDSRINNGSYLGVDGCRACFRCLNQCPTKAIVDNRIVDAKKCISYLTIEKKGYLDTEEARLIGSWLFGCDNCQRCCPYNNDKRPMTDISEFQDNVMDSVLSLLEVLRIDEKTFQKRFCNTALKRAGRENLVRNACIVAANTCFVDAIPQLSSLSLSDNSETIRKQSLAALNILQAIK